MFPKRYESYLFGLLLSGLMSLLISGMATFRIMGLEAEFVGHWIRGWLTAWLIAFPVVVIAAPFVRGIVHWLVRDQTAE